MSDIETVEGHFSVENCTDRVNDIVDYINDEVLAGSGITILAPDLADALATYGYALGVQYRETLATEVYMKTLGVELA